MSKIIRLESQNVKRLKAVEIAPDGQVVIVGGNNGEGKSSVLDSISYALGGKSEQCGMPLRTGTEKGYTVVETDDVVVRRTYTQRGSSLKVFGRDGREYKSPQQILNAMVGSLAFDPLAFMRMPAKEQAATLRTLFGIDVSDLEEQRKQTYDERTLVNRQANERNAQVEGLPYYNDATEAEVPPTKVLEELDEARRHNEKNEAKRAELDGCRRKKEESRQGESDVMEQMESLKRQLADLSKQLSRTFDESTRLTKKEVRLEKEVEQLADIDEGAIKARLTTLDEDNRKVRANVAHAKAVTDLDLLHKKSSDLTQKITDLDRQKTARFEQADLPVPGLTIDEGRVLYNDIPLEQSSQAEQLRVSVAMGMAQHSDLRVMLIREGSLLDEKSLALLRDLAEKNDTQIWLEVVGDRGDCSVVIEDGTVKKRANPK